MKYTVDEIIDNIAKLVSCTTDEVLELNLNLLPINIHEGSILIKEDNIFKEDTKDEEKRRARIEEKLARLKKIQKKD